ncbi:MAG: hypothetical protein DYG98_15330 [Haliscomenobacteraceae bacterium CHB4]|nr:hypothetical protein [Haliscomenobacteraceae bacterium CHB4]
MQLLGTEFIEKVILLLLTAIILFLLLPYLLKVNYDRKLNFQKELELYLLRQKEIIDAQSRLLEDLTLYLWQWRYLCIKLTYYGGKGLSDEFKKAWQQYNEDFWGILNNIRNTISKSRRLVSDNSYTRLLKFYQKIVEIDLSITRDDFKGNNLTGSFENILLMRDYNIEIFKQITSEIDDILKIIAEEVQLNQTINNKKLEK